MMFDCVPQRRAARAAESQLRREAYTQSKSKQKPSPPSPHSFTSKAPTPSDTAVDSSAPLSIDLASPVRKQVSNTNKPESRTRSQPSIPDSESSLSEEDDHEQQKPKAVPLSRKSLKSKPSPRADGLKKQHQNLARRSIADSNSSPEPRELSASASAPTSTARAPSKRSAAQAAQNNIHRSYSEFALDDILATSSAHKKSRSSLSSSTSASARTPKTPRTPSSRSKLDCKDEDEFRSSSQASTSSLPPKSRSKTTSSSQAIKRGRRFRDDQGLEWELQHNICQAARYVAWRKCVQCVAKKGGDTCRFLDFRAFPVDPATDEIYPAGIPDAPKPAFLSSPDSDQVMELPSARPLASDRLLEAQANVATSLLPVLDAELKNAKLPDVLRRPRETECRQMCEFCATSIFSASWFCRRCGREYCPDCKDAIEHLDDSDTNMAKRLALCDKSRSHSVSELVPLTRFDVTLLEQEVVAMRKMLIDTKPLAGAEASLDPSASLPTAFGNPDLDQNDEKETAAIIKWKQIPQAQAGLTADRIIGTHTLRTFDNASFNTDDFRREWAHGEPLLVRNVTESMQHPWGPDELSSRYGNESCLIVRSDTDPPAVEQVSVGEFFSTFGQDRAVKDEILGKGSWKLKDWPPSAEFKQEFPELYEDFNLVVPAPEYTTREGVLNLASCYPTGVIQPDLGPKMYNAWPAGEGVGGQGTTRLHMDIADAVNIMLYAVPPQGDDVPDEHKAGVAAWDIFRAEDADTLRAFLREEHAKLNLKDDPIHIQRFFISAPQRVKLYRDYGVKSWRIYQKAGEAVFIPAGCAHQVCNLTDCVKVAVDFVSPQNVERCFKLTAEFRELVKDYKKAWKEDVLSLRTTLWYAWCTYREMSGKGPNVWAKGQHTEKREAPEEEERKTISRMIFQDV